MLDAYRDLIDELLGTPSEIRGLVEATDEGRIPPEAHRLIAELRGRDRMMLDTFHTMTREEHPYLGRARPAEYAPDEPLAVLLDDFDQARGDLVSLLINLSLKDWERTAIHETEGEVSLADAVESHVEFDESQRQRLRDLLGP